MPQLNEINVSVLNELIVGRVEPHIYAFSTETVPNYLKVGDTYRPLETRLNEWRKYFPNLEKQFSEVAKADNETFFRDFAIHSFLENELKKNRLQPNTLDNLPYYSNEFFENAKVQDLEDAITDIKASHAANNAKYKLYKFDTSRIPETHTYFRSDSYDPRPNQQATIDNFRLALDKGRKNLLMYAVMRFGKSFTSMCCATEMKAKVVVIVSAKADVKEEWKKTVESHIRFTEYEFINSDALLQSDTAISEKLNANKKVVVFLTLQDLQGDEIKTKHKEVFENLIDLLIIDETHFGARASEYGKVLRDDNLSEKEVKGELKLNDASLEDLESTLNKTLNPNVRLHLSGTPYRILMGSEFTNDDIIAFYQFTDIAEDQAKWDSENLSRDEVKEWDNPYYGFPQMVRFAFNPNDSSRRKMEELKKSGITYAFSSLFKPKSIGKDNVNQLHKQFEHEAEILDLLKVIDGTESDDNLLGFLDYDKIKQGNMCRHIVCVLPYRASCDAFENLISTNVGQFKNLSAYEIINIAGVEDERQYKNIQVVKTKIKTCEAQNKKTITLTVNRMLTGSTVEEWDTMLYLKDTASPQEYDQAVFRLQNQYVKNYTEPNGDVVKYNLKPQTLLVDFDPNRMFRMQEQKSQIYNVNTDANGNAELEERIKRELQISPILVLNSNKIVQVEPANVLDAVRKYSSDKSVLDEATAIPVDFSLLNNAQIRAEIEKQGKIGSKQGLEIKPIKGDGEDIDVPIGENGEPVTPEDNDTSKIKPTISEIEETDFESKFATYYSRILFFAFLSNSEVKSLQEIIAAIDSDENNIRISMNLDLNKEILVILHDAINPFTLSILDYKIQNINSLANDHSLQPISRASNAMKKFSRLSESEIVTPEKITDEMISILPDGAVTDSTMILDIAAKQGEFVYATYNKYGKAVADNFYSIPTSKIAYEFTRKVYTLLELDVSHIVGDYTSYDLLEENNIIENDQIKIGDTYMKFDVIVGNPPYQEMDGGAQVSAKPIYHRFIQLTKGLNPQYLTIIVPARWYSGGKGLDEFRDEMLNDNKISELHDFLNPEQLFPNTNIRGGICYFLRDNRYDNKKSLTKVVTHHSNSKPFSVFRSLKTVHSDTFIRHGIAISVIEKIKKHSKFNAFEKYISARKPFGLDGLFIKNKKFRPIKNGLKIPILCYGRGKKIGYVEKDEISTNKVWIDRFKVFTPYANNIGTELSDDNLNTFIGEPGTICTETYIVIGAELKLDKDSANNLTKYFSTKFVRFQHSLAKASQHGTSKTYQFVPLQNFTSASDIDWSQSVADIDRQLYAKYGLSDEEVAFIEGMIKGM
jgi:Eco57I restriction-modification methylase/Type III restriction enzyme, res subunit/T5orf172 domain